TTIKLNNRKILAGIAEIIGEKEKLIDFTVALDKLDKIGREGVVREMLAKGIAETAIEKVSPLFNVEGNNQEKLDQLALMLSASEEGSQGVRELRFVVDTIASLGLKTATLSVEVTLARGLHYYTGAIVEVSAPDTVAMGAIGGGGRYDDLTGIFGLQGMSGMGISFGLDRIYLVLEALNLFEALPLPGPKLLFVNFGTAEAGYAMQAVQSLRNQQIPCELYPDSAKMKKQLHYANRREIPFVVLAGTDEMAAGKFILKDMKSGTQQSCNLQELIEIVG
ncbi:MAG: ATP phosphoribosyltransferase regulatory subunit, partial [Lutibacter sp.]|nr:ATP phosphoribosyltransferase regulatory subunit [Lutibacter sp.]